MNLPRVGLICGLVGMSGSKDFLDKMYNIFIAASWDACQPPHIMAISVDNSREMRKIGFSD